MKRWQKVTMLLIFLAGLSLLLYPSVSNYWNSLRQSSLVSQYDQEVSNLADERRQALLEEAQAYNANLATLPKHFILTEEEQALYNSTLDVSGTGVMGYVEIPRISVSLPIYHGTEKSVLEYAVGHLSGTSLPVGGETTHAVITGHTGLASARLLTDLEELETEDVFYLHVLNQTLTYEVDQIRVVLPDVTDDLEIVPGEDYCTILTCTPYGVNSHRLLVRGHRIETAKDNSVHFASEAVKVDPLLVMPFLAAPALILLFILVMLFPNPNRKKKSSTDIKSAK